MNSNNRFWVILLKVSLGLILVLSFFQVKMKYGWDPIGSFCQKPPSILIDSIRIEGKMNMFVNDTLRLKPHVFPVTASNKRLIWKSDSTTVADVDSTGLITATGKGGKCMITAAATDGSNKMDTFVVVVTPKRLENSDTVLVSSISSSNRSLKVGESYKLLPHNASNKSLKWESSDSEIARVDQKGNVTGLKAGECAITATSTDGSKVSDSWIVKVANIPITSISLNDTKIEEGTSIRLRPIISPSNATNTDLDWSSDSKNVLVSSKGVVTGNKSGVRAVITAKATDGSGEKASCIVEVFNNREISVFHGKAVYNQQKRTITIVKELELDLHKNDGRSITLYPGDIIEGVRVKDGYLKMGELNHNGKMTLLDGLNNKL